MKQNGLHAALEDGVDVVLGEFGLAVDDNLVTLDGHDFAGVFVGKVLDPCLEHTCGELAAHSFFEVGLVYLDFFSESEYR